MTRSCRNDRAQPPGLARGDRRIVRMPQWIDEYGRRNGEGRGKRTSDLIRLMIDVDPEVIEAARGARPTLFHVKLALRRREG
jgi:hypothetical protein